MDAPRGACMVALDRGHAWLLQGGTCGCSGGVCVVAPGGACVAAARGHASLLRGACMVAPGGVCMGYDEIWRRDQ